VTLDGTPANHQIRGDLHICPSEHDEIRYLLLPWGQNCGPAPNARLRCDIDGLFGGHAAARLAGGTGFGWPETPLSTPEGGRQPVGVPWRAPQVFPFAQRSGGLGQLQGCRRPPRASGPVRPSTRIVSGFCPTTPPPVGAIEPVTAVLQPANPATCSLHRVERRSVDCRACWPTQGSRPTRRWDQGRSAADAMPLVADRYAWPYWCSSSSIPNPWQSAPGKPCAEGFPGVLCSTGAARYPRS
jgi:hypothetical protein